MNDDAYVSGEITVDPPVPTAMLATAHFHDPQIAYDMGRALCLPDDGDGTHTTIVCAATDGMTSRTGTLVDDLTELLALLGGGHTFTGEITCTGPGELEHWRVRVVDGAAVAEDAAIVFPADYALTAGPAVVFDPGAARTWLAAHAEDYNIDPHGTYSPTNDDRPGDWIERIIGALSGSASPAPHVWRTAPGVDVEVVETVGVEGWADGGAVLVVEVSGVRIASRWLDDDDLADRGDTDSRGFGIRPQIDVAVEALGTAAREVNDLVERHRRVRASDAAAAAVASLGGLAAQLAAEFGPAGIETAVHTLAELWADPGNGAALSRVQRRVGERAMALWRAYLGSEVDCDVDPDVDPDEHDDSAPGGEQSDAPRSASHRRA